MKSKNAQKIVNVVKEAADENAMAVAYLITKAVELAEAEMRERAVGAFYSVCENNKSGECHAFIVGYETPDDRLHEKCNDIKGTSLCNVRIVDFLYTLNNLEEYKQK